MTDTDVLTPEPDTAPPKKRRRTKLRRVLLVIGAVLGAILLVVGALAAWFLYAPAPAEPELDAEVVHGTLTVDGMERSYLAVVPNALPADAPVIFAFHGSNNTAEGMRAATGYRYDELAIERGFVAVYPQGYEKTWHDCRVETPYPARVDDIDDIAFVSAIIDDLAATQGTSSDRVYATGLSNGGHLSIRLAAERPDLVQGIAAFAAAYPAPQNDACVPAGEPVKTMFVLGTADPINPYEGGMAGAFGSTLGEVLSAEDSAAFIAERNGLADEPTTEPYANVERDGTTDVTAVRYDDATAPVVLLAVEGGGHVVPNPVYAQPRIMGGTTAYLDGPLAAVEFFLD